uniref:Palmitoyltransferase n=1 Tax=Acrobeloides nanus TaxID=290746 RepID=A0A914E9L2_9BILA
MLYADYVVIEWMVLPSFTDSLWGAFHVLAFNSVLFLAFLAHLRAMITDPGIVPMHKNNELTKVRVLPMSDDDYSDESDTDVFLKKPSFVGEDWSLCTKCESFRPPRAHHCRICRRCIRKMDHHCPWVNNCVGEFNQKHFLQFIFYVGILSAYAIGLIITSWVYHDHYGVTGAKGPYGERAQHTKVIHTICLTIESALFGLFVLAVACDQLQAIFNEETVVESVVRRGAGRIRRRPAKSKYELLREVCGPGHWSLWVLPCTSLTAERDFVHFPIDLKNMNV